ncbi:IclR family transcriptional regulator [Mycolicibacterium moriokaense]|jgi:DNA-binding IclR family transcriptional regulator|uniref:IclR family transcriptional regulator n=1 Tax=Mycolicibacterium moriokaense TaxID=39691 RepID=UPI0009F5FC4A|nr:IclR family transcriptional regulator C-terminal domain-containing protein [Mycolicibacterium moriokaense]MCV7037751.1 helix-turn-helix domain-containing protein [Mycolicibacterium moriokaense]ORB22257.1 IclR family transcriptional regulator [Mycolicibacterium moriokaense]
MTRADQNRTTHSARSDGIQVLRRAAAALDEIAASPGQLRLVDLGGRLGLAKSTVRRLLVGLVEIGFASIDDDGRISLGERLLALGGADDASLTMQFRPTLDRLARATGETVDLSVLRGRQMLFIDQVQSTHRLRAVSAVGMRFPLETTANGKAARQLLNDPAANLSAIAFDRDEHTAGISAAGVAARTVGGHIVAISVPAPSERFTANEAGIVDALRESAQALVI